MLRSFFVGCAFACVAGCLDPDPCAGPNASRFAECAARFAGDADTDTDADSDADTDTDSDTDTDTVPVTESGETGSTDPPETAETGQALETGDTGPDDTDLPPETGETGITDTDTGIPIETGDTGSPDTDLPGDTGDTGPVDTGGPINDPTVDDDGDGLAELMGDCDDTEPLVRAGFAEVCDDLDNDCDGTTDDGVLQTFYEDGDGDGFGDANGATDIGCLPIFGFVADATDCDDGDNATYPGAPEPCMAGPDRNCDGSTAFQDADADGWISCAECDDSDGGTYPGAPEICDGEDDDCDGLVDDGVQLSWHPDLDLDGYGNPNVTVQACTPPFGYVADAGDCNDTQSGIHPGLIELCDPEDDDEDCDGLVEDADSNVDGDSKIVSYQDVDGDGFTDFARDNAACFVPVGYVVGGAVDCNDNDNNVYPGAPIGVCDTGDTGLGTDFNCDGSLDCP